MTVPLPPEPPPKPEWATYIASRRPQHKLHTKKGHATNAIYGAGEGTVFRWVDEHWKEVFTLDLSQPISCYYCGKSIKISRWAGKSQHDGMIKDSFEKKWSHYDCKPRVIKNRIEAAQLVLDKYGKGFS